MPDANTEARKSFQMALEADPRYVPAMFGLTRAVANDNPPAAIATARKIFEVNPTRVETHLFLAGQAADAGKRDEARQLIQKALSVNPSSLDAHSLLAALGLRRRQNAGVRGGGGKSPGDVAGTRRGLPRRGRLHRSRLPVRRSGCAGAPCAGHRAFGTNKRSPISACTCCAPATRVRPQRARDVFKLNLHVVTNLLEMMDTLDTFITTEQQEIVLRIDKADAPVLQAPALALARRALDTLSKRTSSRRRGRFHRDVPEARSLRRPHGGVAGDDRRARRLLRLVVTLDSPRARPGEFQEDAVASAMHVITLQMSNQRLPRWLERGHLEFEETIERPPWAAPAT